MIDLISYQEIPQEDFVKTMQSMRPGDVSFDFEANGLDVFDESVKPFSFSVTYEDDPEKMENRYYFVMRKDWTEEQKITFKNFIKSRRCWCYNFSYEGGMIWRYMNELIEFDDAHCLIVADGLCKISRDENNAKMGSGLKEMARLYFHAENWSDVPWTCVECFRDVCKYVRSKISKDRLDWFCYNVFNQFEGEVDLFSLNEDYCSKTTWKAVSALKYLKNYLSKEEIYCRLVSSGFNPDNISLKTIPDRIVGPYCVYDSYWTIKLKKLLYAKWGEDIYKVYLKQSIISCVMLGYSIYWDTAKATELNDKYIELSKELYKNLLKQPQFIESLVSSGLVSEDRIPEIDSCQTIDDYKSFWNVNCSKKSEINVFYDALYKSKDFCNMLSATIMHEFIIQYDDFFFVEISKENIENYDLLEIDLESLMKIENKADIPEVTSKWESGSTFRIPGSRLLRYNNYAKISKLFLDFIISKGEVFGNDLVKFKIAMRDAANANEIYRGSLASDYIEKLYDACTICGYIKPTIELSSMKWEFKLIYCLKFIKKMGKQLSTYINGSLGFENLRGADLRSHNLKELPRRDDLSPNKGLWILKTNPNAVETKRWSSGSHTIPWNTDVRGLIIPRFKEDLVIHYDYSQSEVRMLAALSKCKPLLEAFRNGADIHRNTAAGIWRKSPENVSSAERRFSKMATFSILYLATVESFANSFMQGDVEKAREIYEGFFRTYPEVKDWQDSQNEIVLKEKKVHTLFGDDIYIECNPNNRRSVREAAKCSVNYPIQSSSSSVAGMCIYNLWKKLQGPQNSDILAIPGTFTHDSSDWEVRPDFIPRFFKLANETAVDDVYRDYGVAMAIDFEIGISQNHMMGVENAKFINEGNIEGLEFDFECHEDTFGEIINRFKKYWLVDLDIKKTKIKVDTLDNAFKTRQGFSLNTGVEQKVHYGKIALLRRL